MARLRKFRSHTRALNGSPSSHPFLASQKILSGAWKCGSATELETRRWEGVGIVRRALNSDRHVSGKNGEEQDADGGKVGANRTLGPSSGKGRAEAGQRRGPPDPGGRSVSARARRGSRSSGWTKGARYSLTASRTGAPGLRLQNASYESGRQRQALTSPPFLPTAPSALATPQARSRSLRAGTVAERPPAAYWFESSWRCRSRRS